MTRSCAVPQRSSAIAIAAAPVAASAAMREVLEAASDVAPTPTSVLLVGESGTGKEIVARLIHARSGRAGAWVAVNCAALPGDLLESELFGHERGAFTGASERRAGRFELAHGGTLLLDEVSELPLALQAKLLRAIQEREIDRVGGARPVPVDVRLIATTNRDLAAMVRRGEFRSDLYYRLNVFPIVIPPLRERREDVPALAERIVLEMAHDLGRPAPTLDEAALGVLLRHEFPGNVRELRNVLERAIVRCHGPVLEASTLRLVDAASPAPEPAAPLAPAGPPAPHPLFSLRDAPLDLAQLERLAIAEALRRVGGNRTHAAQMLGIGLRTLRSKLRAWREAGAPLEWAGPAGGQSSPCAPEDHAARCARNAAPARARISHCEGA